MLAAHPPGVQRFMLRTAVLERLCGPLCDAVLETRGSAAELESLARTNLFLLPLDDQRRWYRWHHLFAQLLRAELERREPERVPVLHARAAAWHRASGTTDEAIHHAVAAGAYADAGALIAETWVHYANAGRTASVLDWLGRIPDAVVDADARLLLVAAWVSALRGREPAMRAAIARARALGGLDAGPLPDGFASLESSLAVLGATFGWGDVGAILAHGERSLALEGPDSPWRPVITWALGWAHLCNGDLERADALLAETTRIAPAADQWIVGVAAIADRSLIAGRRGRRDDQWRLAGEAYAARRRGRAARRDRGRRGAHGARRRARGAGPDGGGAGGARARRLPAPPVGPAARPRRRADRARRRRRTASGGGARRSPRPRRCWPAAVTRARSRSGWRRRGGRPGSARLVPALSERELTVLRLLGSGRSEREIGAELYALVQHGPHARQVDLPQARRLLARRGARARRGAEASPR